LDITIITNLILVAILILLTAFFVGSEFAVVKVRLSRIEQLITEGNKRAPAAKKLVENLDYYLSACQLGITVTALGLGILGEPTVERLLHPVFQELDIPSAWSTFISYALALSTMTFLHVVIGELAPKTVAIQYAERVTLIFAGPMVLFGKLLFPLIWALNGSARGLLRLFGLKTAGHEQAHSEEELKFIMKQSFQSGEINQTELSYLQNIFTFDERVARDVMVPRTQIVAIDQSMQNDDILNMINDHHYTRYPVTQEGSKDNIIGFLNAKEVATKIALSRHNPVMDHLHKLDIIHESTPLQGVLIRMQKKGVHMALVIDEFGGTAGLITMEDILEEIVGEIRDEFDDDERSEIVKQGEDEYLISGRVLLEDLERRFGLTFENNNEVDTIGGWLQVQMFTTEGAPQSIQHKNQQWKIIEMDNHQILTVLLKLV